MFYIVPPTTTVRKEINISHYEVMEKPGKISMYIMRVKTRNIHVYHSCENKKLSKTQLQAST